MIFFSDGARREREAVKTTVIFVVNSFHKVAKIYSLLEFFRESRRQTLH
jgi:hypothetical protein